MGKVICLPSVAFCDDSLIYKADSYFLSDERKIHYNQAKASPAPCKLLFCKSIWMLYFRWWIFMIKQYHSMTMSIHITICASGNFSKSIYTSWLKLIQNWLLLWLKLIDSYYRFCVQSCTPLQSEQYPGDLVVQQKCNSSPDV